MLCYSPKVWRITSTQVPSISATTKIWSLFLLLLFCGGREVPFFFLLDCDVFFFFVIIVKMAGSHNMEPTNTISNPNTSGVRRAIHRREPPAHAAWKVPTRNRNLIDELKEIPKLFGYPRILIIQYFRL